MAQKTNRSTKAIEEINKYIKLCEKDTTYSIRWASGALWAFKVAIEIIKKRNI